jgi:DNA repair protein SbcD/Mre11
MKFLHTSDWHVGKVLKGHDRLAEHRAVLNEIVEIANAEQVDLVLIAGDLFESALPVPDAQKLVWETLVALRATGAEVVVISGNHDSASLFDAMSNIFSALKITLIGRPRRPDDGGFVRFVARSTNEPVEIALLPFVSQRGIVSSLHLMGEDMAAAEFNQTYATRVNKLITALTSNFSPDAVRLVVAHAHIHGGVLGGGEREAHTIFDYGVSAQAFGPTLHYVALGHLHRQQKIGGPCPIYYSGSPIQVDFGEQADSKQVLVVEATPTSPAKVRTVPLKTPVTLRTIEATETQLEGMRADFQDGLLRIRVKNAVNIAGLSDKVRSWYPNAIEVRVDLTRPEEAEQSEIRLDTQSPSLLFSAYLKSEGVSDDRVSRLFAELLDKVTSSENS